MCICIRSSAWELFDLIHCFVQHYHAFATTGNLFFCQGMDKGKRLHFWAWSWLPSKERLLLWEPVRYVRVKDCRLQMYPFPPPCSTIPDGIPSTTPGAEPPRDAKDSGSARSHSTHLETSSSYRP